MDISGELIIKRKLNNGFTYYIRRVEHFEKFITMAFTIKLGSIHENENESGLAHLLEHMHMNFHKHNLYANIRYKTKAYTDFFETIFYIKCFNSWENIISCLEIFGHIGKGKFLNELYFSETKNDVISEILGYDEYMQEEKELYTLLLGNSLYMNSLAIGNIEYVSNFSYDKLIEFQNKWYSADIMSIAIVGDVEDTNEVEKHIKIMFEGIAIKKLPTIRFNYEIPKYDNTIIHEIEIKEPYKKGLEVYFKVKRSGLLNFNSIDIEVIETLLFEMIEIKLKDYFRNLNISMLEIECEKINLDLFHMFYVVKTTVKDLNNIVLKDTVNLINEFFNSLTLFNNDSLILTLLEELGDTIEKGKADYYDSVGMHYLLLECIDNYTLSKPLVTYLEKCELLKNSIEKIHIKDIYAYLKYWIYECDRLYIAKV